MSAVLELPCDLIRRRSVTPEDAGCLPLLGERLERTGFHVEHGRYGEVENLWAAHGTDTMSRSSRMGKSISAIQAAHQAIAARRAARAGCVRYCRQCGMRR